MAAFGITANGGSVSVTGGDVSFDRSMTASGGTVVIKGTNALLTLGETSTTIRWALVAIELEARGKGGVIRLQQAAKQ